MKRLGIITVPAIASGAASLVVPMVVLAQTGSPPPDASTTTDLGGWWRAVLLAMGGIAFVVLAIKVPRTRRWIAAGAILAGGACVALIIAFAGTLGGWSGRPAEPWTVPGAIGAMLVSLALAVFVLRRQRSLRHERPTTPLPGRSPQRPGTSREDGSAQG